MMALKSQRLDCVYTFLALERHHGQRGSGRVARRVQPSGGGRRHRRGRGKYVPAPFPPLRPTAPFPVVRVRPRAQ